MGHKVALTRSSSVRASAVQGDVLPACTPGSIGVTSSLQEWRWYFVAVVEFGRYSYQCHHFCVFSFICSWPGSSYFVRFHLVKKK